MNTLHTDPDRYELENKDATHDLAFWDWIMRQQSIRNMLTLGCGPGRVLFPTARLGRELYGDAFHAYGLDISEPFIARAKEHLKADYSDIEPITEIRVGDMTKFNFPEVKFDLVIIPFNALQYVTSPDDQISTLASINQNMELGGRVVIDVLFPRLRDLLEEVESPRPQKIIDLTNPTDEIRSFTRTDLAHYDPATQIDITDYEYRTELKGGKIISDQAKQTWYFYFPGELELLLRHAGFKVVEKFGAHDRREFAGSPPFMLFVTEKIRDM